LQKVRGNLLDLTAQDLLGKSHEELVLMLIHLRRQAAALNEAIDASKYIFSTFLGQCRKILMALTNIFWVTSLKYFRGECLFYQFINNTVYVDIL
jgi:hypothetical protein